MIRKSACFLDFRTAAGASTLALLAGGMLYVLFRPKTLLLFRAAEALGLSETVDAMRLHSLGITLPEWVVYCLPNALWSLAYVLLAHALMAGRSLASQLAVAAIIPLLGIVSEALQGMGLLRGTFDWLDLAAYAVPYLIYIIARIINKNQIAI